MGCLLLSIFSTWGLFFLFLVGIFCSNKVPGVDSFNLEDDSLPLNLKTGKQQWFPNSDALEGIREAIRRRFDNYVNQVREVHGLPGEDGDDTPNLLDGVKRRGRRAVIKADSILPARRRRNITEYNTVGTQIVRVVYPLNPQPFSYQKLADLNTISVKGYSYIFALEDTNSGTVTTIYSISKDLKTQEIVRQFTPGATRVEVNEIGSNIYMLPVEYNETSSIPIDAGSVLYRFDPSSKKLSKVQTIDTSHATAVHFWTGTGEEANDCYLAVAPEFQTKFKRQSFEVEIAVYRWQGGYFDYVYSLPAKNPKSIRHARILSIGYLGVANYQDNTGSTSINSEIFRYSHKDSKYISFQKIRTQGAKNLEFFGVVNAQQEEFFLTIANHCESDLKGKLNYRVKSHIFKFGIDRFIPFQSFETYGAFQFLAVKTESSAILVLGEISGIRVFQYNGWKFTPTNSFDFDFQSLNPSLIKIRPFYTAAQPSFAIASSEAGIEGGIYAMELERKKDYSEIAVELQGDCKKALGRVQAENMSKLVEEISNAPKSTDAKILLESIDFQSPVTITHIATKGMQFSGVSFDADLSKQLAKVEKALLSFEGELKDLKREADGVILRNEDRTINSEIHFQEIDYYGGPLKASEVHAETVNEIRLKDIFPKLIHLDRNYSFDTVTVDDLITDQHIKVNKLNGDLLSDFALKSSQEQTFKAVNRFHESFTVESEVVVNGLLDGIDLNNVNFLLKKGNQSFPGEMKLKRSSVKNLEADIVNGVDLAYYLEEGVSRSGDRKITGAKNFESIQATSFQSDGKMSSVDINDLYERAIVTTGKSSQTFQGRETLFESLETNSLNLVKDKLNDKWGLKDFVSISSGSFALDTVELLRNTIITNLKVEKSLNRIRVSEDGELDLILKDTPKLQTIGSKILDGIHLEKDSEARGLIDGVDLKNWSHEKRIQLKQNRIRVGNFAPKGDIYIEKGFSVEKYGRFILGGQDVTRLLQNSLRLASTELPNNFRGVVIFDSVQVSEDTKTRTINRQLTSNWLPQSDNSGTVIIRGRKTFKGDVTFLSPSFANALYPTQSRAAYGQNQEVFGQLQDLLIDGINQTIQRNSVFESLLTVDRLDCPAENIILNAIPFKNLLFVDSDQVVEGKVRFLKPLEVAKLFNVNGNLETKLLNGQDLNYVISDTLRSHSRTPQSFKADARFDSGLFMENLQTDGNVGSYNTTRLLNHVVRKDLPGIIHGSLTFAQEAKIKKKGIEFTGNMNGISHEEWGQSFLLKSNEHQIIHTPIKFRDLIAKSVTTANNKVSNYNILNLWNTILRIDKGGKLGAVTFVGDVVASDGVNIQTNKVNGINVKEDILLSASKKPQIIEGNKSFSSEWKIDESLIVKFLDSVDYDQAAKFGFGKTEAKDNLRVEGNLVLKSEPYFKSSYNQMDWNEFTSNIWMTEQPATIKNIMQFESITLEKGGLLEGKLDGIDLNYLEAEYLSQSKGQHLSGKVVFESTLTFKNLKTPDIILENGKIDNINLNEFVESVFLQDKDQTIDSMAQFEELIVGNLELGDESLVSGMDLDKDAMTLHGDNVIDSEVTFHELNVDYLTVGNDTLINGIDIKEWIRSSAHEKGDFEIKGVVELVKAQFTQNIEVNGLVDGAEFGVKQIMSLSHDQHVSGATVIEGDDTKLTAKEFKLEKGSVNGIDIQGVIETMVLKDYGTGPLMVSGEKTFLQTVKADSLVTEALFQGYNMSETLKNLKPQSYLSSYLNESLEERYKAMSELALDLHQIVDRREVILENFNLTNRLVYEESCVTSITEVKFITYQQMIIIGSWNSESGIYTLSYGSASSLQMHHKLEFHGKVHDFEEIQIKGQTFLIVSVSSWKQNAVEAITEFEPTKSGKAALEMSPRKQSRTFVLKLSHSNTGGWAVHQILHGHEFRDVEIFDLFNSNGDIRHCASVLEFEPSGGRVIVLCFDSILSELASISSFEDLAMEIFQTLPANASSIATSLSTKERCFMVVGNEGMRPGGEVVDVWMHESNEGKGKFVKETSIPAANLKAMDMSKGAGGHVFLAIALSGTHSFGGVGIYRYIATERKFEKVQSFSLRRVVAVKFQILEPISTQLLLYVQADVGLHVYEYKGLSGFVLKDVLDTSDVVSLETSSYIDKRVFSANAFVASSNEIQVYEAVLKGLVRDETSQNEEIDYKND